jgi:hypothetical protein
MTKILKETFSRKNEFGFLTIVIFILIVYFSLTSIYEIDIKYLFYGLFFCFFVYFISIFYIKKIKYENNYKNISKELPFFINNLANDLEKNISIKNALENRTRDNTLIALKIKQVLENVNNKGFHLKESLLLVSKDHKQLSDVIYQLIEIINSGTKNKAYPLRTLSKTIVEEQAIKMKNYSTKLNLITLLYIVMSAVIPAMLLMFFIVGGNFFEISFSPVTVVFICVVIFPVIDMFLLLVLRSSLP